MSEPAVGDWPAGPGYWAVFRHADVKTVLRDARTFSSWLGATQIRDPDTEQDLAFVRSMMLNQDPPEQSRLRRIVAGAFTPRAVRELETVIEERAAQLIREIPEHDTTDFVRLAADLPVWTLAHILGVPEQDRQLLYDWSSRVIGYQDAEYADGATTDPTALSPHGQQALARRSRPDPACCPGSAAR